MMISIFSFIMSLLWFNLYIVFIALMRRHNGILKHSGIAPFVGLIIISLLRMFCFVEFPFAVVVESGTILTAVMDFLETPVFISHNGDAVIRISAVLITVWILGSVYFLQKYIYQSVKLKKFLSQTLKAQSKLSPFSLSKNVPGFSDKKVRIIQSDEISIPTITGFLRPVIYLPNIPFTDTELKNIIFHEWIHFLHKDLWGKTLMYLICAIFWWNPFVYILKRDFNHILELKCDLALTAKMDEEERLDYLETIINTIKKTKKSKLLITAPNEIGLFSSTAGSSKNLEQRFYLVLHNKPKKLLQKLVVFLFFVLVLVSVYVSYLFIIQSAYSPLDVDYAIDMNSSYLTANDDGTYKLYMDNQYVFDIDHIDKEPYSSLPIK